jgi:hypothetical protein
MSLLTSRQFFSGTTRTRAKNADCHHWPPSRLATWFRKLHQVRVWGVWLEAPRSEARHGYPYPQEQASGPVAGGKSQPAGPSSSSEGPYPRSALLALVSSIVEAGPGYRHIPIHRPLRLGWNRAFGRIHHRPGRWSTISTSPVGPIPADRPHATQDVQSGVALSFLTR